MEKKENYKYLLSDFVPPPAQLKHMDIALSFGTDTVDGENTLSLVARRALSSIDFDAQDLEVFAVERIAYDGSSTPLEHVMDLEARKLRVTLDKPVAKGEAFKIHTRVRCRPSETKLEGIYLDATPEGAPQQFMSQCQQWGFQRILPVFDDCAAKCTYRTTIEADARYTHLISNGDIDRTTNPSGHPEPVPGNPSRQRVTYVNNVPMAPYLFIVAVGTWDSISGEVVTPQGKHVRLEYLVPPGRAEGARVPLEILKDSVLWQARAQRFEYRYDTYRTITMEKSYFGGMENVGNTTIITDAALIDEWTSDARLIYAHGVIVHEYEHNQCGSEVTMATPFDVWLNEAYTVDVERRYLDTVFDPSFMRLRELDAIRDPHVGPLAIEEAGFLGRIVRQGFNDPGELIDGLTYVKAAEVIRMLRFVLGAEAFDRAFDLYFSRFCGGNADTDQFIATIEESTGRNLSQFRREWLETIGYPIVRVRHAYDAVRRELSITLSQTRRGKGGAFVIPFAWAAVDGAGHDIPGASGTLVLDSAENTWTFPVAEEPAFISCNRGATFYGVCEDADATPESLRKQALLDPDLLNRVEAMRRLTEIQRKRILDGLPIETASWGALFREIIAMPGLPDGLRGYLLTIEELPLDRDLLRRPTDLRRAMRELRHAAAEACGDALFDAYAALDTVTGARHLASNGLGAHIERRMLKGVLGGLLAALDKPRAHDALVAHFREAVNITDKLNTLSSIWTSSYAGRDALMEEMREICAPHLSAYMGYLTVVGRSPRADVFDCVSREAARREYNPANPGISRSLVVAATRNNDQLWTDAGMRWLVDATVELAASSENTAMRMLSPLQSAHDLAPMERELGLNALRELLARLDPDAFPVLSARIKQYLG